MNDDKDGVVMGGPRGPGFTNLVKVITGGKAIHKRTLAEST